MCGGVAEASRARTYRVSLTPGRGGPGAAGEAVAACARRQGRAAGAGASVVMGRTDADPDAYLALVIQQAAIHRWADANGVRVER